MERGDTVLQIARQLGVNSNTIYNDINVLRSQRN